MPPRCRWPRGFAGRIGALGVRTTAANLKTGAAAARLHGDADAYQLQDGVGAADLADAGAAAGQMVQAPDVSTPVSPAMPAPPGAPGGVVPTTGQQISAVVHSGPGTQGLLAVAGLLDTQAAELEQAAATVRAAGSETTSSWSSGAAEAAEAHLVGLESSYSDQAIQARSLASQMRGHADDFARAKAVIPPPRVFDDLQRRLQAAYAANAHPASMGRFSGQIADLQHKLAAANHDALDGYGRYQEAAQIKAATIDPHDTKPDTGTPAAADEPAGAGGEQETNHAGTHTQTLDPADPLADPAAFGDAGQAATGLMQTVLPAVLGAVSGAAGGLLGAVSGAGQQLQQAGSQALGGLGPGRQRGDGFGGVAARPATRAAGDRRCRQPMALTPTSAAAGRNPAIPNRPPAAAVAERADRCRRRPGRQRRRRPRPPTFSATPAPAAGGGDRHADGRGDDAGDDADGRPPRRRCGRGRSPAVSRTAHAHRDTTEFRAGQGPPRGPPHPRRQDRGRRRRAVTLTDDEYLARVEGAAASLRARNAAWLEAINHIKVPAVHEAVTARFDSNGTLVEFDIDPFGAVGLHQHRARTDHHRRIAQYPPGAARADDGAVGDLHGTQQPAV